MMSNDPHNYKVEEGEKDELTRMQSVALKSIENIILNLVRRSKTWKTSNKKENSTLSSGLAITGTHHIFFS